MSQKWYVAAAGMARERATPPLLRPSPNSNIRAENTRIYLRYIHGISSVYPAISTPSPDAPRLTTGATDTRRRQPRAQPSGRVPKGVARGRPPPAPRDVRRDSPRIVRLPPSPPPEEGGMARVAVGGFDDQQADARWPRSSGTDNRDRVRQLPEIKESFGRLRLRPPSDAPLTKTQAVFSLSFRSHIAQGAPASSGPQLSARSSSVCVGIGRGFTILAQVPGRKNCGTDCNGQKLH